MPIEFEHLGVKYEMTAEQIEAAFRYQQRQYRRMDAKYQLMVFIYGEDFDGLPKVDRFYSEELFFDKYNMTAADAFTLLDIICDRFDKEERCDVDENSVWDYAISAVLNGY